MPTYLYFCNDCETEFEEFHSINDELKECPKCGSKNPPKRLIPSGTNFVLANGGVGWAKNGYH